MPLRKVIISGGGTGGHIYPALAIANALKKRDPKTDILFVGASNRMEMEAVPKAGYPIEGLWISGLQRKLTKDNLLFPIKVLSSLVRARQIIRGFKPQVVIGVGGYASGPTLRAANRLHIPTLIQEQNSFPGITNKILGKRASKICVAYDGMQQWFAQSKIVKTGNPVRADILDLSAKRNEALREFGLSSERKTLLIIGGSLGARTINQSVDAGLQKLMDAGFQIIWQTGKLYVDQANEALKKLGNPSGIWSKAFIDRMDLAYAAADIIISRAGALSISELCIVGKPAILVPSPNVAEDHQTKNARALTDKQAAVLITDIEARNTLIDSIMELLKDSARQQSLAQNIMTLALPNAAETIVDQIYEIAKS